MQVSSAYAVEYAQPIAEIADHGENDDITAISIPPNTQIILPDNGILAADGIITNGRHIRIVTNATMATYYSGDGLGSTNLTVPASFTQIVIPWNCTGYITPSTATGIAVGSAGIWYNMTGDWTQVTPGQIYRPKPRRGPLIKKSVKSSIKRALKLISNFGMEEDVRIFLGGETIEVSHPDSLFKFVMTKSYNSLLHRTEFAAYSTPYKLELYTKTDVHIANLCVVMKETPILDQVLALAMFVKTGCEVDILHKANYSSLNNDKELRNLLAGDDSIMRQKLRVDDVEINGQFNYDIGSINAAQIVQGALPIEMR